jgi:hypothetical protein
VATEAQWLDVRQRATRYLQGKYGWVNEDLLSEMTLVAIEQRDGQDLNMAVCCLRALDRLNPRHVPNGQHHKVRDAARLVSSSGWTQGIGATSEGIDYGERDKQTLASLLSWRHGYPGPAAAVRHYETAQAQQERLIELVRRHPTGAWRAMLLLNLVYGWTEREIGLLFGVTESRINQLLGHGRAELLAYGSPWDDLDATREMPVPDLEVAWLTL